MRPTFLHTLSDIWTRHSKTIKILLTVMVLVVLLFLSGCSEGDTSTGDGSGVNVTVNVADTTPPRSSPIDSVITILLPSGEPSCGLPNGEIISAERILDDSPNCGSCQSLLAGFCPESFTP